MTSSNAHEVGGRLFLASCMIGFGGQGYTATTYYRGGPDATESEARQGAEESARAEHPGCDVLLVQVLEIPEAHLAEIAAPIDGPLTEANGKLAFGACLLRRPDELRGRTDYALLVAYRSGADASPEEAEWDARESAVDGRSGWRVWASKGMDVPFHHLAAVYGPDARAFSSDDAPADLDCDASPAPGPRP